MDAGEHAAEAWSLYGITPRRDNCIHLQCIEAAQHSLEGQLARARSALIERFRSDILYQGLAFDV